MSHDMPFYGDNAPRDVTSNTPGLDFARESIRSAYDLLGQYELIAPNQENQRVMRDLAEAMYHLTDGTTNESNEGE